MTREDKLRIVANTYIGHEPEIDEGIEVSMRRAAFCDGANYELDRIEKKFKDWMYDKLLEGYIDVSKSCIESWIVAFIKIIEE